MIKLWTAAFFVLLCLACSSFAQTINPTLVNLPDNTAIDLGPYTCTDVEGEFARKCRAVTDYSGMVYDNNRHQMVVFGGGHASTNYNGVNTFNLSTLKWIEKYQPIGCSYMTSQNYNFADGFWSRSAAAPDAKPAARHTVDLMTVAGNELILLSIVEGNGICPQFVGQAYTSLEFHSPTAKIAHYNLDTNTWSFSNTVGVRDWPAAEYDPISGKVIILGTNELIVYDPITKTKTTAINIRNVYFVKDEAGNFLGNDLGYNNELVYYPPNQKMYLFDRVKQRVFEVALDRSDFSKSTVTRLNITGTYPPLKELGYAYDSTNQIIGGAIYQNVFYAFNPVTKTWTSRTIQGGTPGSMAFHAIDYDPINNVFIFINDWQQSNGARTWAYRYAGGGASSPLTLDTVAPSSPTALTATPVSSSQIKLSWNVSTDNAGVIGYQIYRNGTQISTVATNSYHDIGLSPSTTYTYRVAAYDADGNLSGQSSAVDVTTLAPTRSLSGLDFQTRCSQPGVIRCVGFDDPSAIAGRYGSNTGIIPGNSTIPTLDTTVRASGSSSLKFTIPGKGANANASGLYFANFSPDLSTQFGANSEFYFQFRQRFSAELLSTILAETVSMGAADITPSANTGANVVFTASAPIFTPAHVNWLIVDNTAPYTHLATITRFIDSSHVTANIYRDFNGTLTNGNWWLIKLQGGIKQGNTTTGDQPGQIVNSCEALGITMENTLQRGFTILYHSCTGSSSHGAYDGFHEKTNNDIKLQNAREFPFCLYSQGFTYPKTYFAPKGNCFGYFPDEWMTYQMHVKVGPIGSKGIPQPSCTVVGPPPCDEYVNSYVRFWMARESQPSELVVDWGPYSLSAYDRNRPTMNQKYGKIWLTPYATNKSPDQVTQTYSVWYDELIISRNRIPDPTANSSVQAPADPSELAIK